LYSFLPENKQTKRLFFGDLPLAIPASAGQSPVVTFEDVDEKRGALSSKYHYRPFVGDVNFFSKKC
jgi:hypothetical protein